MVVWHKKNFCWLFILIILYIIYGIMNNRCEQCKGKGEITCTKCNGKGKTPGLLWGENPCTRCDQTGTIYCPSCNGTGKVKEK